MWQECVVGATATAFAHVLLCTRLLVFALPSSAIAVGHRRPTARCRLDVLLRIANLTGRRLALLCIKYASNFTRGMLLWSYAAESNKIVAKKQYVYQK